MVCVFVFCACKLRVYTVHANYVCVLCACKLRVCILCMVFCACKLRVCILCMQIQCWHVYITHTYTFMCSISCSISWYLHRRTCKV